MSKMKSVLGLLMAGAVFAVALFFTEGNAQEAQKSPQTKCPITGMTINKDFHLDYQGQRIYFCSPDCSKDFMKDPEKYFAKMAEEKVLLESVQKNCPVLGEPINKNVFLDYKGRRVYFCCAGCIGEFKKAPETFLNKLPGENKTAGHGLLRRSSLRLRRLEARAWTIAFGVRGGVWEVRTWGVESGAWSACPPKAGEA